MLMGSKQAMLPLRCAELLSLAGECDCACACVYAGVAGGRVGRVCRTSAGGD